MKIKNRVVVELLPADSGRVVEFHVTNVVLTLRHEIYFRFPLRQNKQLEDAGQRAERLLRYFFENGAQSVTLYPRSIRMVLTGAYTPEKVSVDFATVIGRECFGKVGFEIDTGNCGPETGYYSPGTASLDCDGIPSAIVAVTDGEPLVLLVSEDTYNAFNVTRDMLGISHVALANRLRERTCRDGGQFHKNSVMAALRRC